MSNISTKQHLDAANKFRELLSTYQNSEDLINIGAYKRGSSREIDEAIQFYPQLIQFLKQGTDEPALLEESIAALTSLTGNEE